MGGDRSRVLRHQASFLSVSLLLVGVLALACGAGGSAAPRSTSIGEAPTPADSGAIRQVDLTKAPALQNALRQVGGGDIDLKAIVYADLTGDRREEAVVPVDSGGTLGNIAYLVFTLRGGGPELILTRTPGRSSAGGLKMVVENGKLVETAAEYGPQDPLCCPSALRRTTFRWDGAMLQVEREEKVSTTPGPKQ